MMRSLVVIQVTLILIAKQIPVFTVPECIIQKYFICSPGIWVIVDAIIQEYFRSVPIDKTL
jgi:hypothetical protein